MKTPVELLMMLAADPTSKVVSTAALSVSEIESARADDRMTVAEGGFGFVFIPNVWRAKQS